MSAAATLPISGLSFSAAANPKLYSFAPPPQMPSPPPPRRRRRQLRVSVRAFAETEQQQQCRPEIKMTMTTESLYEVLRVSNDATQTEIKTAYRSLAKQYHPDATSSSELSDGRDFIEIHNAYATLSDPAARAMYDLSLSARVHCGRSSPVGFRPNGFYSTRRWETDQCW